VKREALSNFFLPIEKAGRGPTSQLRHKDPKKCQGGGGRMHQLAASRTGKKGDK